MTNSYYVYVHKRADNGEVFYVGCATKYPHKRGYKSQHSRAYDFRQRKQEWFDVRDSAGGVTVELVQEFPVRADAFALEIELIAKYGRADRGAGQLVNHTDGGDGMPGFKDRPESRRMKSVTKVGELNPMYGKTGADHPNSRKVRDRETGVTFDSVQIAAEALGYKMKTLYNWLSGHRKNPTPLEFA